VQPPDAVDLARRLGLGGERRGEEGQGAGHKQIRSSVRSMSFMANGRIRGVRPSLTIISTSHIGPVEPA
jgi:hypothetical protein